MNIFVGEFKSEQRRAEIVQDDNGGYLVDCYADGVFKRTIDVSDHALRYAEDTAENWVTGIIKE